ncbi:MAG: tetratricopeptide repeat protein [Burkholderiaceae bacterium]
MRSAERHPLNALPLALLAATLLAGCGSVGTRLRDALPGASTSAPAQAASATAATAAASANAFGMAKPASTGPIAPATQRAYDDALALMRAGHVADAERMFRALTQSDPDLAGPHANLGVLARQAGHAGVAVTELEKATALAPGMAVAWNQLGLAYRQNGDFAKAKGAYEHALSIDPNYANAALNLGVLDDLYLGDGAHALELYTRYLALTPAGDPVVAKWVADVKNRQAKAAAPAASAPAAAGAPKEKS